MKTHLNPPCEGGLTDISVIVGYFLYVNNYFVFSEP